MFEHSRGLYRDLRPLVTVDPRRPGAVERSLLAACHDVVVDLAREGGRAGLPARRLFARIRHLVPPHLQLHAYAVVERALGGVVEDMLGEARRSGRANLLTCAAGTPRGAPCRREPLSGSRYCPAHKHLETLACVGPGDQVPAPPAPAVVPPRAAA
jgi:hypothetical protein